jgi:hypothetical protein
MNYGITADKVGTRGYFDAAVDNKCRLLKAEVSELANNNTVIDLTYVTEDGLCNQLQRIFPVNASNLTPRQGQTFDEMEAELVKNFNTKLRHIATKFNLSEEDFAKIDGSSFEALAKSYCSMLNRGIAKDSPLLYLKTYTDKAGYTKVSDSVPFLQRVDTGECTLKWTSKETASMGAAAVPNGVHAKEITSI